MPGGSRLGVNNSNVLQVGGGACDRCLALGECWRHMRRLLAAQWSPAAPLG